MKPTFQDGDFLYSHPAAKELVRGDVVVFIDPNNQRTIVHRVVSAASVAGLITRGDHNRLCDEPIAVDQVIGKVELTENERGIKPVVSGRRGWWLAQAWQAIFWLGGLFRQLFWAPYQWLRKSGLATYIWQPKIVKIQVRKMDEWQIKYIYKQRTVASWEPALRRFACRKPFDLVIPNPEKPETGAKK